MSGSLELAISRTARVDRQGEASSRQVARI
ncbi:hypothetical protein J2Y48_002466 [Mycoplana sp. BE70]|nr:hypothetical protein [Mycoplana sp. BE70]